MRNFSAAMLAGSVIAIARLSGDGLGLRAEYDSKL
jgi:hypothetical protein